MVLQDLFALLSYGELSNLSLSNNGSGTIVTASQPKLVNYTNEALLKLYSRFILAEDDLLLMLVEDIVFYNLTPEYSVNYKPTGTTDNQPVRYIIDLPECPFQDEVIKVLSVRNSNGHTIALNDDGAHRSVFTPRAKVLQVTAPWCGEFLSVSYQKRHLQLLGDLEDVICLPDVLVSALTAYIAYKVYSHMNSVESTAKSQEFLATYENTCAEAVDRDLVNSSISQTNVRFSHGGWV